MPMRERMILVFSRVSTTGFRQMCPTPRSSKLYAVVSSSAVFAEPIVPYRKYSLPFRFMLAKLDKNRQKSAYRCYKKRVHQTISSHMSDELSCHTLLAGFYVGRGAGSHDSASRFSSSGPHVDDIVGASYHVEIMLNHNYCGT